MWLLLAGLATGFVVALMASRLIASQMYGISVRDPLSFTVVSLILSGISLFACAIAARRALSIGSVTALRWD